MEKVGPIGISLPGMDILVIESSPHKKGSSNLLAEHFIQGAEEAAGILIFRIRDRFWEQDAVWFP